MLEALQSHELESLAENDWGVDLEFKPVYAEYDFSGDLIPTHPSALTNNCHQ